VRILHTSDWHIGRAVRGRSREDEHRQVLAEIADIIAREKIDLVLIAGDVFDHAAPSARDEEIAYEALLAFTRAGAEVAMIAGNHDHPERLAALQPFLKLAHIHTGARLLKESDGGCVQVATASGETAAIALMPWLRRGNVIKADDLMAKEQAGNQSIYSASWKLALRDLTAGFSARSVNLVLAHVVFTGALIGGGERPSETAEEYWVPKQDLALDGAQYLGLGHIHKQQDLGLTTPAWYCGSPLQLDFGEEEDRKGVLVFEAQAGLPVSDVRAIELTSGRRMLTIPGKRYRGHARPGSLEHLRQLATSSDFGDAYLRVYVNEAARPGLADEVRDLFPNAVAVYLEDASAPDVPFDQRQGLQPRELLSMYFEQKRVREEGVLELFDELIEEELASPTA
jgi:exonuclease SbcD